LPFDVAFESTAPVLSAGAAEVVPVESAAADVVVVSLFPPLLLPFDDEEATLSLGSEDFPVDPDLPEGTAASPTAFVVEGEDEAEDEPPALALWPPLGSWRYVNRLRLWIPDPESYYNIICTENVEIIEERQTHRWRCLSSQI
jgi:hypothetical protein